MTGHGYGVKLAVIAAAVYLPALAAVCPASGFGHTYEIGTGTVVIANTQANSSWVPLSILIRYDTPGTGGVEVRRESHGQDFLLAACAFTNVTTIVWVPDIHYPFGYGDALVIKSSVTNGVVQLLRKGG